MSDTDEKVTPRSQADQLLWEMPDGSVKLLPRSEWPYEPRHLGTITSLPQYKPSTD